MAVNALEDQRIETLLGAQYPTLAGYFVEAFQADTDRGYTCCSSAADSPTAPQVGRARKIRENSPGPAELLTVGGPP